MKQRVLLVLLDVKLSQTIESALQTAGFKVFSAPGRYKAILLMHEKNPEFIILERSLPEADVILLSRTIRTAMKLPAMSILLVSDRANCSSRFVGRDDRFDDDLVRPFEMEDLLEKLASMHNKLTGRSIKTGAQSGRY